MLKLKEVDRIVQYLPIILFFIYSIGFLDSYIYYNFFRIDIVNFLKLEDLIFQSTEYILSAFLIFIFMNYVETFYISSKTRPEDTAVFITKTIKYLENKYRMFAIKFFARLFLGGLILLFDKWHVFIGFLIIITIESLYTIFSNKMDKVVLKFSYLLQVVLFLFFIALSAYHRFYNFKRKGPSQYFSIVDTTNTYSSKNDEYRIIGQTSEYVFLFESSTEESIIIKKEDISQFRIGKVKR